MAMAPPVQHSLDPVVERHQTASGITLELPDLASLDCHGIRVVLQRLDLSDYRGRDVLTEGHPDYAVFVYEDQLARALYFDCILRQNDPRAAESVFMRGFGATAN